MIRKRTNQAHRLLVMLMALFAISIGAKAAQQTSVASWVFSEGWDSETKGTVVYYTPDGSG